MGNKIEPILIQIGKLPEPQKKFIMDFYNYKTRGQYTENNVGTYLKIIKNFAQENPDTNLTELTQDDILAFFNPLKMTVIIHTFNDTFLR